MGQTAEVIMRCSVCGSAKLVPWTMRDEYRCLYCHTVQKIEPQRQEKPKTVNRKVWGPPMDYSELDEIVDGILDKPLGSRLDPYKEAILRWRRRGLSYRKIQRVLLEHCGIRIGFETLRLYVLRRTRPRKPLAAEEAPEPGLMPDRWAAERERMRKHKESPVSATPEPRRFEYTDEDASKPLY